MATQTRKRHLHAWGPWRDSAIYFDRQRRTCNTTSCGAREARLASAKLRALVMRSGVAPCELCGKPGKLPSKTASVGAICDACVGGMADLKNAQND